MAKLSKIIRQNNNSSRYTFIRQMLGGETCQRCNNKSSSHTMSMFNTDIICMECKQSEMKLPEYEAARQKETEECLKGNFNFEGIGLPTG